MGHVKAEFFMDGVGWVPVDPTNGEFANEEGNFLVSRVGDDFSIPTPHWGIKQTPLPDLWLGWTGAGGSSNKERSYVMIVAKKIGSR